MLGVDVTSVVVMNGEVITNERATSTGTERDTRGIRQV